ncbi:acetyl-CoA carboxylase biotin carboxyl carrier protein [Polynucleobacter necessarius]|uniref:acetyl-CoA carboxylase biotin carboxyl carrier protein n=1 Tax=Polynucleobacter necessarius TaxID=576610 RepID=UPI000FE19602|nr:acetyl-CoA carboxylase biotin carboxyl carrier protein [Polynucleobacter necessarius]
MDLRKLKTLIDLVSESGISELEVNEGEDRVRIVNAGSSAPIGQVVYANPAPSQTMQAAPVAAAAPAAESGFVARSPMVGTFYRAPNPESPNFVNIGDTVKVGQTLCIIEAMKLLNEIESEHAGVVKEILCENGQGVEFDQPLFIIA